MRRAVRYGDAWHPIRFRMDWLESTGLPGLQRIAESEGAAVPALCPRVNLRFTHLPMEEAKRFAGQGSVDQVRRDLDRLAGLGAKYVLLDTYGGKPEATLDPGVDCGFCGSCFRHHVQASTAATRMAPEIARRTIQDRELLTMSAGPRREPRVEPVFLL